LFEYLRVKPGNSQRNGGTQPANAATQNQNAADLSHDEPLREQPESRRREHPIFRVTTLLAFGNARGMSNHASLGPRKTPTQQRSKALVEALKNAAARILARRTIDEMTTNELADLAGISIGSLYQYFPNKQALVAALVRSRAAEDIAELTRFLDPPAEVPLAVAIRQGVSALAAHHRKSPHLYRILLRAVPDLGEYEAVRELARDGRTRLAAFLRARTHETRPLDPELAALVLGRAVEAAIHEVILERPTLLDDPRLEAELTTLCLSYLGATSGAVPA
jgi:AcrR family transcriptional regulator